MQYKRGILEVYLSSVIADTVYSEYTRSILLYQNFFVYLATL